MVMGVNRRRGPFSSANCRTIDVPDSVAASLWDARTFRTAKRLRHRTWNVVTPSRCRLTGTSAAFLEIMKRFALTRRKRS